MSTVWFSLRRRLLLSILGGITVLWLTTLVFSYIDSRHEAGELFDAQLAQTSQTLLALASHEAHEGDEGISELGVSLDDYQHSLRFQVWRKDGSIALRSRNAPRARMTQLNQGFSDVAENGQQWRYYSNWDPSGQLQVQVGENQAIRDELAAQIAWRLLLPALFGLPLLSIWVWLATRRGLIPLATVAKQIHMRDPGHLQALEPASAPVEIKPLLDALNGLFARVEQTLENERRFTADAAHELRTPLAALAVQAQVALRSTKHSERQHAIEQFHGGVDRVAHLIDQLLTMARLDPEQPLADAQQVPLRSLAEEVCAEHGAIAVGKRIVLELEADNIHVLGNAAMLGILLRNLLDNAIRYTPAGGRVKVMVKMNADQSAAILQVSDTGPGIPEGAHDLAFRRFHRLDATRNDAEQAGSGLGLSIVQRIAELHRAKIDLGKGAEDKGLRISIAFTAGLSSGAQPHTREEHPQA